MIIYGRPVPGVHDATLENKSRGIELVTARYRNVRSDRSATASAERVAFNTSVFFPESKYIFFFILIVTGSSTTFFRRRITGLRSKKTACYRTRYPVTERHSTNVPIVGRELNLCRNVSGMQFSMAVAIPRVSAYAVKALAGR